MLAFVVVVTGLVFALCASSNRTMSTGKMSTGSAVDARAQEPPVVDTEGKRVDPPEGKDPVATGSLPRTGVDRALTGAAIGLALVGFGLACVDAAAGSVEGRRRRRKRSKTPAPAALWLSDGGRRST